MSSKITGIIEIPLGSYFKYEVNKADGTLEIDRVIEKPYPENYGYIPNTLSDDGDPIDVFVLAGMPIAPLARVKLEIIGIINMVDNGFNDEKLIARIVGDNIENPEVYIDHISTFLSTYKTGVLIKSIGGKTEAIKTLNEAILRYENRFPPETL